MEHHQPACCTKSYQTRSLTYLSLERSRAPCARTFQLTTPFQTAAEWMRSKYPPTTVSNVTFPFINYFVELNAVFENVCVCVAYSCNRVIRWIKLHEVCTKPLLTVCMSIATAVNQRSKRTPAFCTPPYPCTQPNCRCICGCCGIVCADFPKTSIVCTWYFNTLLQKWTCGFYFNELYYVTFLNPQTCQYNGVTYLPWKTMTIRRLSS